MELNLFDVIKGIVNTSKSFLLRKKLGKITFEVNKLANKVMIRQAVEDAWDVKVDNVRVINIRGKQRFFKRRATRLADVKKAIVTLKPGYNIDLKDQFESMGIEQSAPDKRKE